MKWCGWIILPLLFMIYFLFSRHYQEKEVEMRVQLNQEVAATEFTVKEKLDRINSNLPSLETRLAAEKMKTSGIIAKNQELTVKIAGLTSRKEGLSTQIDALNSTRSDTQSKKKDNLQEIKALQKKITAYQQDINLLKTQLQTVTEL